MIYKFSGEPRSEPNCKLELSKIIFQLKKQYPDIKILKESIELCYGRPNFSYKWHIEIENYELPDILATANEIHIIQDK